MLTNYPRHEIYQFGAEVPVSNRFRPLLEQWLPISLFANILNRSLAHDDAYPFAPIMMVNNKSVWVYDTLLSGLEI